MNERTIELMNEANKTVGFTGNIVEMAKVQELMDKFAKLIMQECIRVPYAMWDKAELNADIAVKIENRIREHFGVEE